MLWVVAMAFFAWPLYGADFDWVIAMLAGDPDPAALTIPPEIFPLLAITTAGSLLGHWVLAAFEAACLRWLVRGQTSGLFGFSFGKDTWNVVLCLPDLDPYLHRRLSRVDVVRRPCRIAGGGRCLCDA